MTSTGCTVVGTKAGDLGEHATVVSKILPSDGSCFLARQIHLAVERFGTVVISHDFGTTWLMVSSDRVEHSSLALV